MGVSKAVNDMNIELLDQHCLIENLSANRELKGLSCSRLARLMGVHENLVHLFERGETDPKLSFLQKYANALGGHLEITFVKNYEHEEN